MGRWFKVGSFVAALSMLTLACGSDDDDDGGTGGVGGAGGGTGGTAGSAGTGGTAGSAGSSGSAGAQGITCPELCAQVAPLACSKGPPSESLCVAFCDGTRAGTDACADAMKAVLACETTSSAMSCDAAGYVTSPSCASEWTAVNPCLPQV